MAAEILRGARPFNGLNGVTGLLCAATNRFLQLLEGPTESVELAMNRIRADARHHRIETLADGSVEARAFSDWAMGYRDQGDPVGLLDEQMRVLVAETPRHIGDRFKQFVIA